MIISVKPKKIHQWFLNKKPIKGFSLLEVMVALAILAVSFTALILIQSRATHLAIEARNISIATQLARLQLMECKREAEKKIPSVADLNLEGDFIDQGFPQFRWECHAPKFNMKTPSVSQVEEGIKKNTIEGAKKDVSGSSSVSAPVISMITDTLGNSVRELAVIIRWSDNKVEDEVRVVTHVIDLAAMAGLSRMLSQGAKSLEQPASNTAPPSGPPTTPPRGP
jgi:prepilin-type N-terminal cleavage/methylation domain-containing protein